MSDATFRSAMLADVAAILDIEHHSFVHVEERFDESRVRYLINSPRMIVIVAELNGRLLGWVAGFAWLRGGKPWGRIYAIAVHPDARGRRLGPRLLDRIITDLESLGARRLFLEVRPDNHSAIRLYEKVGFTTCKLLENYYGPGRAAQRMVREDRR